MTTLPVRPRVPGRLPRGGQAKDKQEFERAAGGASIRWTWRGPRWYFEGRALTGGEIDLVTKGSVGEALDREAQENRGDPREAKL